jgi:hypothetical protein
MGIQNYKQKSIFYTLSSLVAHFYKIGQSSSLDIKNMNPGWMFNYSQLELIKPEMQPGDTLVVSG